MLTALYVLGIIAGVALVAAGAYLAGHESGRRQEQTLWVQAALDDTMLVVGQRRFMVCFFRDSDIDDDDDSDAGRVDFDFPPSPIGDFKPTHSISLEATAGP